MPPRFAALLVSVACWDAWRLLLGRVGDASTAATVLALAGYFARQVWRADDVPVRPAPLAAALGLVAVTAWTGPALLQIGAAAAAMVMTVQPRGRWPVLAVALLALPVLPTLDYLLAYPLRHTSALISAVMLRMQGVDVSVEGVALAWGDQRLLFDGPCSGVHMLWAALLLASLVAAVRGLGPARLALLLSGAALLALFGNALRAAGLFYIETGFVPQLDGPSTHEAVGLAAFALVGAATVALPNLLQRSRP